MSPTIDRGSTSLAVVLTAPVLVLLMFAGFQAALWNHTRAEARLLAHETAMLVARDGASTVEAAAVARQLLDSESFLQQATVDVRRVGGVVSVRITGQAPGIVRFTSVDLAVESAVPVEGWVPL